MSAQLKRKFALCGVLLAFVVAAVPTVAFAKHGADDPAAHNQGIDERAGHDANDDNGVDAQPHG